LHAWWAVVGDSEDFRTQDPIHPAKHLEVLDEEMEVDRYT